MSGSRVSCCSGLRPEEFSAAAAAASAAAVAVARENVPSLAKLPREPLKMSPFSHDTLQRIESSQQSHCVPGSPLSSSTTASPVQLTCEPITDLGLAVLTRCSQEAIESTSPLIVHSARVRQWVSETASTPAHPVHIPSPQTIPIRDACCTASAAHGDYMKLDGEVEPHKRQKLDTSVAGPESPVISALTRAASDAKVRKMQPFMPGSKPGYGCASSPIMRAVQENRMERSPLAPLSREAVGARSQLGIDSHEWCLALGDFCDSELVKPSVRCATTSNLFDRLGAAASGVRVDAQMRENVVPWNSDGREKYSASTISVQSSHHKDVNLGAALAQQDQDSQVLVWLSVDPSNDKVGLSLLSMAV